MVAILIKSDLRNKTHEEIKEIFITATDPDRSTAMKGYENKEVYHNFSEREFEEMKENPEQFNYNQK